MLAAHRMEGTCRAAIVGLIGLLVPATSAAQDIATDRKWEVDAHVGFLGPGLGGGTSHPLPAAEVFTTVAGAPSAAVSSWFFGAGAALFNRVTSGIAAPIAAFDPAVQAGITRRRGGIDLGFTMARWLTPRLAVEVQGDYAPSGIVMNNVTLASMERTATSYTEAWSQLFDAGLAAGGFPSEVVVDGEAERGGGHQFVVTGGLRVVVHAKRRFRSYVGAGAGISNTWTRPISAALRGAYQFTARVTTSATSSGSVPVRFAEQDELRLDARFLDTRTFVGTVHGGFEYYSDAHRGVRLDVAVLLSPHRVSTVLNATPTVLGQEPAGAIAGTTTPTIQFSSRPASVARSTLSGAPLRDVETFRADGMHAQIKVSAAYFLRF